jgi:hypothetical protein
MKKSIVLTILIVLINSCAVPKKEYYVFDRYTPKKVVRPEQNVLQSDAEAVLPQGIALPVLKQAEIQSLENTSLPHVKSNTAKHQRTNGDAKSKQRPFSSVAKQTNDYTLKPLQPQPSSMQRKSGDGILLYATALIGLSVLTAIRLMRPVTTKLTRWARANPRKTQGLIAGIHLPLLGLGVMNGYNLDQMGYVVSDPLLYGFGAAAIAGFAAAPYVRQKDWMVLPRTVNRNRLSFLGIVLSTLMLATGVGNKIERNFQDTYLASAVRSIDQTVFTSSLITDTDPVNNTKSKENVQKDRKTKAGMSAGAAFILTFLLVLTSCVGICLAIGGFSSAFASGGASIAAVIGGLGILALSVYGITQISRKRKIEKEVDNKQGL